MDVGLLNGEKLVAVREPFVNINCHGGVRECKAPVYTDPRFMDYRANQVITFWVCCAGDFTDEVNGGFLNEKDVNCVSARVKEVMDCFSGFVGVLE